MVDQAGRETVVAVDSVASAAIVAPSQEGTGDRRGLGSSARRNALLPPDLRGLPDAATLLADATADTGVSVQTVIGPDNRYRITATTSSPWVQIPQITLNRTDQGGGGYVCTGWLFGNRTLATAAHCLTDGSGSVTATNIKVWFGLNGNTAYVQCGVNVTAVPAAYVNAADANFDWAILVLNCNAGNVLGHLGYRVQDSAPDGANWAVTGYPADKFDPAVGYTMWSDTDPVFVHSGYHWGYEIDTAGGQSGAPVWRLESGTACGNCSIGIHTYGANLGLAYNLGNRITPAVAQAFSAYAATYP